MKTTLWRLALLVLTICLLPACAQLPSLGRPTPGPGYQRAEETLFQEAEAAYRRQAYRQAYQKYGAYLGRYPQGAQATQARLREAELSGLLGDWQGSLRRYQSLLDRYPQPDIALQARYGIGRAYFKLGQYQQATQVLDNLTAADLPRSLWFSTQALLAEIALKQGNVTQAFSRLRLAAQDLPSGDQEWFDDLKTRLVEQAAPGELEQLATLYRDHPLSAALLLRLGRLAQEAGRAQEAGKWFETLKERFPGSPEAAAIEKVAVGGKVMVGALLPLSGQLSNLGFRVQRGMELAARQAPVELKFLDARSDTVAQVTRELAAEERLMAILGPISSAAAQAAADAAQAASVPLLALAQREGLTRAGNFVFQAFLTPRQQVRALVQRTAAMGIKHYAVLSPDSSYGRTLLQNLQEELAAQGLDLAAQEEYASGTRDFAPALASLADLLKSQGEGEAAGGGTALFIPDDAATVAAIAGQLAATSLKGIRLLGTNLLHTPKVPESQLAALQGVLFPDAFFAGDPNPAVQSFIAAYRQQYGEDPDYLALQGYVTVRLMGQLLASHRPASRADASRQLLSLREVPDLPWFKGFNAEREEVAALYLLTIKDGRIQMASSPAEAAPRP